MFAWLLLAIVMLAGWTGLMGWSFEHVENHCLQANQTLLIENKQGPLQSCR